MAGLNEAGALFTKLIEDGRKRKRDEELASALLGSGRRQIAAGNANARKTPVGGSLASRVGISKKPVPPRSAAASPINGIRNGNQHQRGLNRAVSDSRLDHRARALENATSDGASSGLRNQINIRNSSNGTGFSIRGNAAPQKTTVVAQNFAMGTTALDIESVMLSISDEVQCRLVASNPTVIAELVFPDRQSAETVVSKFNNKMADGHLLHVYIKNSPNNPTHARLPPSGPRADRWQHPRDDEMQEVDRDRQRYDEERRNNAKRAEAEYQDGRYGFDEPRQYRDARPLGPRGTSRLYSDDLMDSRRGRYGR